MARDVLQQECESRERSIYQVPATAQKVLVRQANMPGKEMPGARVAGVVLPATPQKALMR